MTGKTHIIGGLAFAAATTSFWGIYQPHSMQEAVNWGTFFLGASVAGSLFPDIDHGNAKASNINIFTKILSVFLRITCGHRGAVHSPFMMLVFSISFHYFLAFLGVAERNNMKMVFGFIVGYFSHLLIDMTNEYGISLMFPILWDGRGKPKKFRLFSLPEGGLCEFFMWVVFVLVFAVCLHMVWHNL